MRDGWVVAWRILGVNNAAWVSINNAIYIGSALAAVIHFSTYRLGLIDGKQNMIVQSICIDRSISITSNIDFMLWTTWIRWLIRNDIASSFDIAYWRRNSSILIRRLCRLNNLCSTEVIIDSLYLRLLLTILISQQLHLKKVSIVGINNQFVKFTVFNIFTLSGDRDEWFFGVYD